MALKLLEIMTKYRWTSYLSGNSLDITVTKLLRGSSLNLEVRVQINDNGDRPLRQCSDFTWDQLHCPAHLTQAVQPYYKLRTKYWQWLLLNARRPITE